MKLTPIGEHAARSASPARRARRFPRVFEPKTIWRYIHLVCGDVTTPEASERWRIWAPEGKEWCDPCGKWVKREAPYKSPPIPEEPLF